MEGHTMQGLFLAGLLLIASIAAQAPTNATTAFDGTWDTVISCPDAAGAMGFSFRFDSLVKNGELHGEHGTKGKAGFLELNGTLVAEGVSHLLVNGLVGAAQFAVGSRPAGTPYAYKVDATFHGNDGTGKRTQGRPCDLTFHRASRSTGAD
jgi:hypothetical protein